VVVHPLGKGEVTSSNLVIGSIFIERVSSVASKERKRVLRV
jgi:hypothetical protein